MNFSTGPKIVCNGVLLVMIGVGGFLCGHHQSSAYSGKMITNQLYENTPSSLATRVQLLKMLRSGQIVQGEDMLEKMIDADLRTLVLYKKMPADQRNAEIIESIRSVKEYRRMYPQHHVHPAISESVKMALDLAE